MQIKTQLEELTIQNAVDIDGKERTVMAVLDLHELFQQGGSTSWEGNGKTSKAILLAGDIWLVRIPSKEAGEYVWVKFQVKDYSSSLRDFYKGDATPGPAKQFAMNKQRVEVPYNLFNQDWKVTDIGTFLVQGTDNKALKNGDRIYFVTSRGENDTWLLYLDARHGEAKGTGVALVGKSFDPEAEVESIL